jgi:acetyl-CoA acyltransferase 1
MKKSDDIVIVGSYRTPITKATKGGLAHMKNNEILYEHLKNTLQKINLSPDQIDYVCLGNVLSEMNGTIDARHACLRANIPIHVPVMTVNRECASGLESFEIAKNMVLLNKYKVCLVGGFESMTCHSIPKGNLNDHGDNKMAAGCLLSMIETADKLAADFNLQREQIDLYAYESHHKAFTSVESGLFKNEILPIKNVESDDCVRMPNLEKIKSLKTIYPSGSTTAGNASQLSDGCSLAFIMKRETAEALKLPIQGTFVDYLAVGVDPSIMGIGPAVVIPKILERNQLGISEIDMFEVNEAFSSQALYCKEILGVPNAKWNTRGGSIGLGHPVGCTGARLVSTLLNNLYPAQTGIISLCAGTGHGAAALIRKE